MPGRTEGAIGALILMITAFLAWQVGWRGHLERLMGQRARLREQVSRVRAQKRWVRSLESAVAMVDARLAQVAAVATEVSPHLLQNEGDRLRLLQARDQGVRGAGETLLSPEGNGGPPQRFAYPVPLDPMPALNPLRDAFLREHPRAVFDSWGVPREIEVLRFEERFTLEAPLKGLFNFLESVEADPLLIQVLSLKVTGFKSERGGEDRVSAFITLAAPGWPDDAEPGR